MMRPRLLLPAGFSLVLVSALSALAGEPTNRATEPIARFENKNWKAAHEANVAKAAAGDVDLVFVGDSLTARWEQHPDVWNEFFGKHRAAAQGIGGDQTEHLLWRLQNGELDGISPKLVVLLIGANNMSKKLNYTPGQIAEGVEANLAEIRTRFPEAQVILVSIPPRVTAMDDWLNEKNREVNSLIRPLADGEAVIYLDLWPLFVGSDGETRPELFDDMTHFNEAGYRVFAEAVMPFATRVLAP